MSILIKDMDLPQKNPWIVAIVKIYPNGQVRDFHNNALLGKAVEVPTPHDSLVEKEKIK